MGIYEVDSRIRYSEVDKDCRLTLVSLLDYFQNCSVFHSEDLNLGVSYLAKHNEAWVLSSWQICIDEMPSLAEQVKVRTWAYDMKAFYGYRNFSLENTSGKRLAYADTTWVYMDLETMRPKKIPDSIANAYGSSTPIEMPPCDRKIKLADTMTEQEPFTVPGYFIDSNNHMNNSKYVLAALEYVPCDFKFSQVRTEYKVSAKLGDTIHPSVYTDATRTVVALNTAEGRPYAVVEFTC